MKGKIMKMSSHCDKMLVRLRNTKLSVCTTETTELTEEKRNREVNRIKPQVLLHISDRFCTFLKKEN